MGANVADCVDHFQAQNRRRQPAVHRTRLAVLADDQAVYGLAQFPLEKLDGLDVVDTEHLPVGRAPGRADRCRGCDPRVVRHFVDADNAGFPGVHGSGAKHATVIGPPTPTSGKHGAAADGSLDIPCSKNASHVRLSSQLMFSLPSLTDDTIAATCSMADRGGSARVQSSRSCARRVAS